MAYHMSPVHHPLVNKLYRKNTHWTRLSNDSFQDNIKNSTTNLHIRTYVSTVPFPKVKRQNAYHDELTHKYIKKQ